ncbi:sigma-54-dependent transcriptional regulator [Paucibacter sp. Y2R2-4]|uniref:sigma-54-dependent transcriptional regulator n=1 Tax=Paucibacter sp. Y2R2-4 TaxID=2893553 RepID=UPI0021E37846|nr:sigma-54 dependent transcriptional regulator [Paucibacter sp. Y2R2-4]MCV2352387.1 sigma-54 dependent transcriptional regulator [Paucibacter sp. Y2R2-4]
MSILILDDDPDVGIAAKLLLQRRFGPVRLLQQPADLSAALDAEPVELLLLDMNFLPGRIDGAQGQAVLAEVMRRAQPPAVIVMTAYAEVNLAVASLKAGAFDFITKPWNNDKLLATVAAALASRQPKAVVVAAASALLGESRVMHELRSLIRSVAPTEANVLVLGEMGSGKELVAREIHALSKRAGQTFLSVDLGALSDSTLESELFGHKRGSFTDARSERLGRFQAAQGGTLFLDEVANMPLAAQAKLLTVLERREVTPLGADAAVPIDVRIVSATNLDEAALFDAQRFRPDLLYRLNTIVLRLPPLRERREDIPLLAQHYLAHYAAQYQKPDRSLSSQALAGLMAHDWHGNVRALRHACERAVILAPGEQFELADFALQRAPQASVASPVASPVFGDSEEASPAMLPLSERERAALEEAMQAAQGNISQAARLLGLSRAALYRRLEKYGL